MVDEAGLPDPVPNHGLVLDGQRRFLDVAWPEHMVVLEFDGYEPHMVRAVFDDDRVRQNSLVAAGWTVFRVTSRMLEDDPRGVLGALATTIGSRGHENRHMCRIS
jgi:very-short-patch-repair endonuclease